jgi:hypothetical protein
MAHRQFHSPINSVYDRPLSFPAVPAAGRESEVRMAYVLKCDDLRRAVEVLRVALATYNAR